MNKRTLAVAACIMLGACAQQPSRDAVASNQQRGFQHCVNRSLLQTTSIADHDRGRRGPRKHGPVQPPPSPTPDINAITQDCL